MENYANMLSGKTGVVAIKKNMVERFEQGMEQDREIYLATRGICSRGAGYW